MRRCQQLPTLPKAREEEMASAPAPCKGEEGALTAFIGLEQISCTGWLEMKAGTERMQETAKLY